MGHYQSLAANTTYKTEEYAEDEEHNKEDKEHLDQSKSLKKEQARPNISVKR